LGPTVPTPKEVTVTVTVVSGMHLEDVEIPDAQTGSRMSLAVTGRRVARSS